MAKTSDIQRDLGALKADVEKLRTHTADLVSKVADVSKETVDTAIDNSKKVVKQASNTSKEAVKQAAKTIEKNPVATIAGAVGVGVVLGGLMKRLLRRKKR
jgi:ElaB/YqjD/DUF883 family membrane-anchored ribosome-binding protein